MTPTLQRSRALLAAVLLLSSVSCGPKVVVARLATPTAEVSRAAATPTPPVRGQPAVSSLPASAVPTSSRPTATATATARPTPASAALTAARPTATATVTARPTPAPRIVATEPPPTRTPSPSPTKTPVAPAAAPRPSPSATAIRTPVRPSPPPVATATRTPIPRPTNSPAPPTAPPSAQIAAPLVATASAQPPLSPLAAAASLPGEWAFRADTGKGVIAGTLRFRSTASGLAGVYVGLHGNATELLELHAAGAGLSFDLVTPTAVWHLDGTVSADSIEGTFQTADRAIRWTAVRKPAATPSATPRS